MIIVNGYEKEYTLDLNIYPYNSHSLKVSSYNDKGKSPWDIYFVSNKFADVKKNGNELLIDIDFKMLKTNVTIVLRNYNKELFKIFITPNDEATMEKNYEFYADNKNVSDGILSFEIVSKRNGKDFPWKCTYSGMPLSYDINKHEHVGSTVVTVKLLSRMYSDFKSKLIFTQEESENEIELILLNTKEGIKKVD